MKVAGHVRRADTPTKSLPPYWKDSSKARGMTLPIMEDASPYLADESGMSAYDALVFNTRRENLPDFGDWELAERRRKRGLKSYVRGGQGVCLHPHRLLRAVRAGPSSTR